MTTIPVLLAGSPVLNQTLYHRIQFLVGDSAAWIGNLDGGSLLLVRDIEMGRAREVAHADRVGCAADYAPAAGLSGDRDTALAQAVAECIRRAGHSVVRTDQTLPYLFAHYLQAADIDIVFDPDLGVVDRRRKSAHELELIREAQLMTHEAMRMACGRVAQAIAAADGSLVQDGALLTSERLRREITAFLLERGYSTPMDSIAVTVPHVADCHHHGSGPLRTGLPVIVDIFPRNEHSRYWGDCTRTVVHGEASETCTRMHAAVVAAKLSGEAALKAGTTGAAVHNATLATILEHGFAFKRGTSEADQAVPAMRHGTGHGIGLSVHEPILLDEGGGDIFANEVFTIEPGIYSSVHGGVRVEDMAVVTDLGCEVVGELHQGLDWA